MRVVTPGAFLAAEATLPGMEKDETGKGILFGGRQPSWRPYEDVAHTPYGPTTISHVVSMPVLAAERLPLGILSSQDL
jgi:hypothetical protein